MYSVMNSDELTEAIKRYFISLYFIGELINSTHLWFNPELDLVGTTSPVIIVSHRTVRDKKPTDQNCAAHKYTWQRRRDQ